MTNEKELQTIANILRRDVLEMTTSAGSGHPTSCLSCAEIMSALFFHEMSYDINDPNNLGNDEFILSKGHAAPILYSCLFRSGCIKDNLNDYRKLTSNLEGHPIPSSLKQVKVATGSLGQGLSVSAGIALAGKLQKRKFRTYVLLGDSELAEGSNYEALQLASYYNLDNLCAIIDVNRLGQRGETMLGYNIESYKKRLQSFGWEVYIFDGHNISQILLALKKSRNIKKPVVMLAKTMKGKGISFLEDENGWHGKVLSKEELVKALKKIPNHSFPEIKIKEPDHIFPQSIISKKNILNKYSKNEKIATREAYGKALSNLAESDSSIIVLDAEVSNSTYAEMVKKVKPEQFVECFIAEQNMIGMALGLSIKGYKVFASSFAAFLSRAHDQIRMSALSSANFTICGSHAGISIGQDGPSQMGLEDLALFRSLPNSIIFYPSDAVSTEKLVSLSLLFKGIKYIRTTRPKTSVIYNNEEEFTLGDFKILKQSEKDFAILVGSGITLHECLKAHDLLKAQGIETAVIDLYCIKPFNTKDFLAFVNHHGKKVIVAEDHYKEGGIGEMLTSKLSDTGIKIKTLSVNERPHSGTTSELLEKYRIDAKAIVQETKNFITEKRT